MNKSQLRRLCTRNFTVCAELCLRILDKEDVSSTIPFTLNPVQRKIWALERRLLKETGRSRLIVLKGRQGGVTTLNAAINLWLALFEQHQRVTMLVHKGSGSDNPLAMFFSMVRRMWDEWPEERRWLLPARTTGRTYWFEFPHIDSRFSMGTVGSAGVGRGITLSRLHGSEYATWKDLPTVLNAIKPALDRDGTASQLESSPGVYDSDAHDLWRAAADPKHPWTQIFLAWPNTDFARQLWTPLEEDFTGNWPADVPDELAPLTDEELYLVSQFEIEPERILWRRRAILEMGQTFFDQEYPDNPNTCWLRGGNLVYGDLDLRALDELTHDLPPIKSREKKYGSDLIWYCPPGVVRDHCVMGVDVAEGGGGDNSVLEVRTVNDYKLICTFSSNVTDVLDFASLIVEVAKQLPRTFLVIERNGLGSSVIASINKDHGYPKSLQYRVNPDLAQTKDKRRTKYGWATTGATKQFLLAANRALFKGALLTLREEAGLAGLEPPSPECVRDTFSIVWDEDNPEKVDLNGKDAFVASALTWIGRQYQLGREVGDVEIVKLPH